MEASMDEGTAEAEAETTTTLRTECFAVVVVVEHNWTLVVVVHIEGIEIVAVDEIVAVIARLLV